MARQDLLPNDPKNEGATSMTVNYIPEGYHTVTPYLFVPNAAEMIEFMKQAFDATDCLFVGRSQTNDLLFIGRRTEPRHEALTFRSQVFLDTLKECGIHVVSPFVQREINLAYLFPDIRTLQVSAA